MKLRSRRRTPVVAAASAVAVLAAMLPMNAAAVGVVNNDTAKIAPKALLNQKLNWETCTFPNSDADAAKQAELLAVPGVVCATIKVPRNWHNPNDGHRITLRISKTQTVDPAKAQGYALVNPGGPGGSGLHWSAGMALRSPALAKTYNFVGFDPRGVGESTELFCPHDVAGAEAAIGDLRADGEYTLRDFWSASSHDGRAEALGCAKNDLTPFITTEQTSYDMDFIRVLLGQKKISYLGFSYGTWLGAWFASIFPSKISRMLLDSSTDVSQKSLQSTWDVQPLSRERQFDDLLLPYIARHDDLYDLGTDPVVIRRRWESTGGSRNFLANVLYAFDITSAMYHNEAYDGAAAAVAFIIHFMEDHGVSVYPTTVPAAVDTAISATQQIITSATLSTAGREMLQDSLKRLQSYREAISSNGADPNQPGNGFPAAFNAIRCNDGNWSHDSDRWWNWYQKQIDVAPINVPFDLEPACEFWPSAPTSPPKRPSNFPKIIMVSRELDAATEYNGALNGFRNSIPGGTLISVDDEGSHGVFPANSSCVDDPIMTYFNTGKMPKKQYIGCAGTNALPGETKVYKTAGKTVADGSIQLPVQTARMKKASEITKELFANKPDGALGALFDWCFGACGPVAPQAPAAKAAAAATTAPIDKKSAGQLARMQDYLPQPTISIP
jgi:pimeloyl-ACP methyl ester carboxylesterase